MGVTKKVIKEGDGKSYPQIGNNCTMHYSGAFEANGVTFDSSIGREPLEFAVGQGQVIRGWDEGVLRMSLGEKARLRISSDFAYGPRGRYPVIPPNADLVFEVELLAINGRTAPKDGKGEDDMYTLLQGLFSAGLACMALKVCGCIS
eukprot:TRINITY_DN6557_c0_g3_i1.p2 TRINITY_DN6557_c0_g3~~TRINITY_DN6557_c0_g3_i1.p2  ORF type:complete len:147 (+),score=18.85 TRINITY_DN6557_c0_g3_i1:108-548(+)